MRVDHVPLLPIQRDIYRLPRGTDRFRSYLRTMLKEEGNEVELPPLVLANPMAREHVSSLIDELLGLDAEAEARRVVERVAPGLPGTFAPLNLSLVVVDDARGGWTNRWAIEYAARAIAFDVKRPWLSGMLWSSEPASIETVRRTVHATLLRASEFLVHGPPTSVRELLTREGRIAAAVGDPRPRLDPDEADRVRRTIRPLLDEPCEIRVGVECLFGDEAAASLGFTPRGIPSWGGTRLAAAEPLDADGP